MYMYVLCKGRIKGICGGIYANFIIEHLKKKIVFFSVNGGSATEAKKKNEMLLNLSYRIYI